MSRSNANKDVKRKASSSPIRVVIRLAWSGARLTVPTTTENNDPLPPIRASSITLLDLILRLESALPPSLFQNGGRSSSSTSATLVCLRKVVPQDQWADTTLQQMLDGDDGSAGVVLTLDIGASPSSSGGSSTIAIGTIKNNSLTNVISSAASSLNIKPTVATAANFIDLTSARAEPMEITEPDDAPPPPFSTSIDLTASPCPTTTDKTMSPEHAWNKILQSNFDATSKDCLHALLKIIDNLLSRPNEPKVRSIRCANAAFDKKVGSISGGNDFLFSIGFLPKYPTLQSWGSTARTPEMLELAPEHESRETLLLARTVLIQSAVKDLGIEEDTLPPAPPKLLPSPTIPTTDHPLVTSRLADSTSGFNVYKTHSYNIQSAALGAPDPYSNVATGATISITERQLNELQSKKEKLEREMQSNIESNRGLVAYRDGSIPIRNDAALSSTAASGEGKSDSSLVAARMKRMEEERRKREEGGFTTKAMRDLEKMKKAKVYSHAQIRVNFSDGASLHAKFLPREKVSTIRSIIRSAFQPSLAQSLDFDLYVAPPRRLLDDRKTLEEEELVPAAKIHVSWKGGASTVGGAAGCYLRDELFSEGANNIAAASFPDAKPIMNEQKKASVNVQGKDGTGNSGGGSQSKEELLMQRMLGKKVGLLGGRKTGGDNNDKDSEKKNDKPKWFKG